MQNKNKTDSSWSLSGAFKKANDFILKYPGMMGIPFYAFFAGAAASTAKENPDATLFDVGENFYGHMLDVVVNDFIPGTSFILSELFDTAASVVTDMILPGMGALTKANASLTNG